MSDYGIKYDKPAGVGPKGLGGAGLNLALSALDTESTMVTIHDDFDDVVNGQDTFGGAGIFEDSSWILTDVGSPVADEIGMNDPGDVEVWAPSCLRVFVGTADDAGGNMQLDHINGAYGTELTEARFPHLWIPETAAGVTVLDNTDWVFGCRVGLRADLTTTGSGDWDSKLFVGWAEAGDTGIMTAATGDITITSGGPLVGFHVTEAGIIEGISHRTVATAMAEGTNFTALGSAGMVDGTTALGSTTAGDTVWFDLALRMRITDMSDDDANGTTEFYWRRLQPETAPGRRVHPLVSNGRWTKHRTVLSNQTPNNDVALVPTIEVINGPTAGRDAVIFLDSWTFGCSRLSRK